MIKYKELEEARDKLVEGFEKTRSEKDSTDFIESVKLVLSDVFLNNVSPKTALDILTYIALKIMRKHPELMDDDDDFDEYVA